MELARAVLVYCVFANPAEAERVCTTVVREGMAACANILGECTSFYTWKGTFQTSLESPAVLKTTTLRYPALEKRIKQLHSYENPAIVALPIAKGSKPYLKWIAGCCKPVKKKR